MLLGDEGLEDVGSGHDADGDVALVHHGEAVDLVLEHHPRRLSHVCLGSHAAQTKKIKKYIKMVWRSVIEPAMKGGDVCMMMNINKQIVDNKYETT